MRYGVLGTLLVSRDGVDVTPRGKRPRDSLAVLLRRRGDTVSPDTLLELVWADEADRMDVAAVHTVIARLRSKLGKDCVETQDGGYRLVTDNTDIDEDVFLEYVADASRARERRDKETAVTALRNALALWRDQTAYVDVSDPIVVADRARLAEQRVAAAEQLTELLLDSAIPDALHLARGIAQDEPLRERSHQLLMLALFRSGRPREALEAFEQLRARLREELGIEPGPAITALHDRLLDHDPDLEGPASLPTMAAPTRARARVAVPLPVVPLIGRDHELAAVLDALGSGRRLVTVVGPGGVGKSRLLAEVGVRLADQPTAYVDLSGLGDVDVDELAEATARAVGLGVPGGDAVDDLIAGLGDSNVLVLFDEAEWALPATAALVEALLLRCRGVRMVVTTRRALDVLGERQIPLSPLALPSVEADLEEIAGSPAVRLLTDRLVDHGGSASPDDLRPLAVIARRLDGLPLALELVAAHATTHTAVELVSLIDEPLEMSASNRDREDRHQSLRDTLMWSVARLDQEHRAVLRRLGVFAGTFDIAAAVAVAGTGADTERLVRDLAREALVHVERGSGALRVRLLRTVRDLALSELSALELADARRRHREWFASRWRGTELHDELVQALRRDHDDYLAALRSALQDGSSGAGDLTVTLTYLWNWTEAYAPGLRWTQRVLDSGLLRTIDRARVQVQRAAMLLRTDRQAASDALDEAIPVLLGRGEPTWLVSAYNVRAVERSDAGQLWSALAAASDAVLWARRDALPRLPEALGLLAGVQAAIGGEEDPIATAEEAWALVRGTASATDLVPVVSNVSQALTEAGAGERGLAMLTEAMDEVRRRWAGEPPLVMSLNAGWAALGAGDPRRALGFFKALLAGRPDGEPDRWGVEALAGAGCSLIAIGSLHALRVLDGALVLADRFGLVLTPWQMTNIEQARAEAVASGEPSVVTGDASGGMPGPAAAPLPEPTAVLATELNRLVRDDPV